jgi:hypothetical protein
MEQIGLSWLRVGSSGGLVWTRWWTFGFHKTAGYFLTSWVTISFSNILHHGVTKNCTSKPVQIMVQFLFIILCNINFYYVNCVRYKLQLSAVSSFSIWIVFHTVPSWDSNRIPDEYKSRPVPSYSLWTNGQQSRGIISECHSLGYGLDDRGSIPGGCWEFFPKPPRPERLWGTPSLLSNGYQGLFPWG